MTVTQQLIDANRPVSGIWTETPAFHSGRVFLRLTKAGWQFTESGPDSVLVLKPGGAGWHEVTDDACDCPGYRWKGCCSHRIAVEFCGGVGRIRELLEGLTANVHYGPPCKKCGNRFDILINDVCELCAGGK